MKIDRRRRGQNTRTPTSSRWESELAVKSSHSTQGNPHTIEEVRRILRLHAELRDDEGTNDRNVRRASRKAREWKGTQMRKIHKGSQITKIQPIGPRWKRPILALLIGMSSLCGVGAAHGKECLKVKFPDQAVVDGTTLMLNGLGLRQATALRVNVYVAALYVAKLSTDADAILSASTPKQLVLHFVRSVGRSDLSKAWDEGFEANAKEQLAALKERIEKFKTLMADMKAGEQLSFTHKPGKGVAVDMGGATKGVIEGDDFAKALLSIWLGAHPPNAGLKTGLLGGSCA